MPSGGPSTSDRSPAGVSGTTRGPRMLHSARIKLTVWYVSALAAFIAVLGGGVYLVQKSQLQANVDSGVVATAHSAAVQLQHHPSTNLQIRYEPRYRVLVAPRSQDWWTNGLLSYRSVLAATQNGHDARTVATDEGQVRVYSLLVSIHSKPAAVIQVGRSLAPEEEALDNLLHLLLVGAVGAVALAAGGGWFLAGRALVPVRQAFDRQNTFVGDASHELRTPLAVIKANAEFLQQSQPENAEVADIVAEADRMSALVDSLLALARGDGAGARPQERFDLGLVVETSVDTLRPLAEERRVALDVRRDGEPADLRVDGDREQIKQLMVILLDNALRYTEAGGRVAVELSRQNGSGVVAVEDTGIGIAPEAIDHVFDRFYRGDEARNRDSGGVGLGLAIARELVSDHGGRISAQSRPGEGSRFTVELPLAQQG